MKIVYRKRPATWIRRFSRQLRTWSMSPKIGVYDIGKSSKTILRVKSITQISVEGERKDLAASNRVEEVSCEGLSLNLSVLHSL